MTSIDPPWAAPHNRVLHVVVYEVRLEKGKQWEARCVEHDIHIVVGQFIGESMTRFNAKMREIATAKLDEGWSPRYVHGLSWIPKSDPSVQALWDAAVAAGGSSTTWRCNMHDGPWSEYHVHFAHHYGKK